MASYSQFSKSPHRTEELLNLLKIVTHNQVFIPINNWPDYEITEYQKGISANYYFHNSWEFGHLFQSVIKLDFIENHILHSDNLKDLSEAYDIDYDYTNYDIANFLMEVHKTDSNALAMYGFEEGTEDFKLNNLRLSSIDNIDRVINYEGSFFGDSSDFDPLDYGIHSLVRITGIPNEITDLDFYKSLIAESYILLKEGKLKQAYFITYSAFESFINLSLGTGDEPGERLEDRFKELFSIRFPNIATHQIYTSVIKFFNAYTINRHAIAHGRKKNNLSKQEVEETFLFVLLLLSAYEFNCSTFDELNILLKQI